MIFGKAEISEEIWYLQHIRISVNLLYYVRISSQAETMKDGDMFFAFRRITMLP